MKKLYYIVFFITLFLSCESENSHGSTLNNQTHKIFINSSRTVNTFDGLGALVSYGKLLYDYPQKQRDEIMDYLFLPNYGANLQILKVEIGYDGNNTAMSWPSYKRELNEEPVFDRGYAVWYMKEAKKRNPEIILSALHWGYPAWADTDELKADFVADYVIGLYQKHNLHIDYIGGNQNESAITPEITKMIRSRLDANGMKDVKIICADEGSKVTEFKVIDALRTDKEYYDIVDVIGVHYKSRPASFMPAQAYSLCKPIWSSEDGGGNYSSPSHGQNWIDQLIKLLYDVKITGVIRWLATASIYDNMPWPNNGIMKTKEPWSGHYQIGANLWAFAHFTQFIKPGWMLIDTDSYLISDGQGGGYGRYIAYCNKETQDYSIVVTTYADLSDDGIDLKIVPKNLKTADLHIWRSRFENPNEQFIYTGIVSPDEKGSYHIHLDKDCVYTITTTTGQRKGNTDIPAAKTLELPYKDDFESYSDGEMARFFVNASGTFEVCDMSGNKVLRQVIRNKPILWHPKSGFVAQPLAESGDMAWVDYSVRIEAMLENEGTVALAGRLDPYTNNTEEYQLQAHWLYLNDKGDWKLCYRNKTEEVIKAQGNVSYKIGQWTEMKLCMKGKIISAYIGGEKVAEITNMYPIAGNIAIATLAPDASDFYSQTERLTTAVYDNLIIEPL